MRRCTYFLLLFLLYTSTVFATEKLRVCTWNVLNYSISNDDGRTASYKKILDEIAPDILVVQEMVENAAVEKFANEALANNRWALSAFIDGSDTDNILYYDKSKLILHQTTSYPTALRNITEYVLQIKATGDTLRVFSAHLKANDTQEDALARDTEAQVLQNRLLQITGGEQAYIIVAGDLNFYSTSEPAYIRLTSSATSLLTDLLDGWTRNDGAQSILYTQSTRTVADANCGGGTTGGIDDRFDFILPSGALAAKYVQGSYTVFGNDGVDRLNSSIDNPPNLSVSADIAAALRCASDHLPVYADFVFDNKTSVPESFQSASIRIYPMPVTDGSVVEVYSDENYISIVDILGQEIYATTIEGDRIILPHLTPGIYVCRVGVKAIAFVVWSHH